MLSPSPVTVKGRSWLNPFSELIVISTPLFVLSCNCGVCVYWS